MRHGGRGARAKLQHAARIRGCDDLRTGRIHSGDFLLEQCRRHLGMKDVVDAGAAAAEVREWHLTKRKAGYGPEELTRLHTDLLAVREVARVLVGDRSVERFEVRGIQFDGAEEFVDV